MKIFDWLINMIGILITIVFIALVVAGFNSVRMKLNEIGGKYHTLQPR